MKEAILAMLKSRNDYISGQEICHKFQVSRTAVWKAINSLKDSGYEIEAVRNRGYKLISSPDVLLSEEIQSLLDCKWFGNKILYFDEIDSTSEELKRQETSKLPHGTIAIAESQTAGKGRRGRNWKSPRGAGIWMSLLLRPEIPPFKASMLTLVAALATANAIKDVTGLEPKIKWPNDIVVNGRKIVGILTEMSAEMTCINYVIVGIGINVNTKEFPDDIKATAGSLATEAGHDFKRGPIVAAFGRYFEKYYEEFCRCEDLSFMKEEYESMLVNIGRQVYILEKDQKKERKALGINASGELLVSDEQGNIENIMAGEVSVRGIYGYT